MPEFNRQEAENRLSSQINEQQSLPGMERYSNDPQIPLGKSMFDVAMQRDQLNKNMETTNLYLAEQAKTLEKINRLQAIQYKTSEAFKKQHEEVLKLNGERLKKEMESFKLLKQRKEVSKDLKEMDEKGYENLKDAQKLRIKDVQEQIAQARALKREGLDPQDIPASLAGTNPRELMNRAAPGGLGARAGRAMSGRLAGTWLGRQIEEAKVAGRGVSLTNPASFLNLARANPVVSAALFGAYELRGFGEGRGFAIPGLGTVPLSDWQTQLAAGQVTGEGYGAGLAARGEGLRMGFNPFDQVSMAVANSIVTAVRGQGFRGALAREYENSIKDIYKDLGVDVNLIAQIGEQFVRRGRFDEFRSSMEQLDQIAHDTGLSVQQVAEQFKSLNDQLLAGGGIQNAPLAAGILGATNRSFSMLTGQQRSSIQQFTVAGFSAFSGLPETIAQTPFGAQLGRERMSAVLGQFSQQFRSLGPSTGPPNRQQQGLIGALRAMPQFAGLDYPSLLHVLRDPGYLNRIPRSANRSQVNAAFEAAHGAGVTARQRGVDEILGGERGVNLSAMQRQAYVRTLENRLDDTKLSKQQIATIITPLEHAAYGHGDWGRTLSHAGAMARRYSDVQTEHKGHLNIRLDPNETRKLLSGKNVSKAVQLESAFEGKAKSLGTSFLDAFP